MARRGFREQKRVYSLLVVVIGEVRGRARVGHQGVHLRFLVVPVVVMVAQGCVEAVEIRPSTDQPPVDVARWGVEMEFCVQKVWNCADRFKNPVVRHARGKFRKTQDLVQGVSVYDCPLGRRVMEVLVRGLDVLVDMFVIPCQMRVEKLVRR